MSWGSEKEGAPVALLEVLSTASTDLAGWHTGGLPGSMIIGTTAGTPPWPLSQHLLPSKTYPGGRSSDEPYDTAEGQMPGKGNLGPSRVATMDGLRGLALTETPNMWHITSRYTQGNQGEMKIAQEVSTGPH